VHKRQVAVADLVDVRAGNCLDRVGDGLGVAGVGGVDGQVDDQAVGVGADGDDDDVASGA